MKNIIILLSSLLVLSFISCKTSTEVTKDSMTVQDAPEAKSLLWEISGNGLDKTSFLFGTIHMIASEDYFLPEGTLSAIDVTEKMVFEIDMADLSNPAKLMPLMQKAYMNGDTSLQDLMTEEDYKVVSDHFSDLGIPMFFMERIKPMFLTVFASGDMDPNGMKDGSIKSYEMEFAAIAENSGKSTGGLESIDFQIGLFDAIPYKDQADMLLETVKNGSEGDETMKKLVAKYKEQDVEALYDMMHEDESTAEFEDVLLVKRNKNWIPQMSTMMTEQRTFFAVGAGHLGGSNGVINLLREAGYSVKPAQSL